MNELLERIENGEVLVDPGELKWSIRRDVHTHTDEYGRETEYINLRDLEDTFRKYGLEV